MYITGLIEKLAVIAPEISIKLIKDGSVLFTTPGNGSALDAVYAVYGKETAKALVPVSFKYEGGRIEGFTGLTSFVRGNRGLQVVFVNGRLIHSKTVSAAIDEAYKNAVMKNKFPICFLMIYCEPLISRHVRAWSLHLPSGRSRRRVRFFGLSTGQRHPWAQDFCANG